MSLYKIYKTVYSACDKLEDKVRGHFSHYPIIYAFVGAVGIVVFWRGVWHTADYLMYWLAVSSSTASSVDVNLGVWWDGPLSIVVGGVMLLMTGVFVSNFIGNEIIISGLKKEKKIAEKTEEEVKSEDERLNSVRGQIASINNQMGSLKAELDEILEASQSKETKM